MKIFNDCVSAIFNAIFIAKKCGKVFVKGITIWAKRLIMNVLLRFNLSQGCHNLSHISVTPCDRFVTPFIVVSY